MARPPLTIIGRLDLVVVQARLYSPVDTARPRIGGDPASGDGPQTR